MGCDMLGFTLWFTGLSGAGKTTLAHAVERELRDRGLKVEVLDGDVVRTNLSKGLGFSREDRDTNIRRIGFVCKLLSRNEVVAIAAAISPYKAVRDENRGEIGRFVEAFCDCPLGTLEARDTKGLYARARRGEVQQFTGISDPYEPPDRAEIVVDTGRENERQSAGTILRTLELLGYIPERGSAAADTKLDGSIRDRLRRLGYQV